MYGILKFNNPLINAIAKFKISFGNEMIKSITPCVTVEIVLVINVIVLLPILPPLMIPAATSLARAANKNNPMILIIVTINVLILSAF